MKIAAIIFIALGMFVNFAYSIVLGVIGLIIGIIALISLATDHRNVAIGILALIFTGLLGGIFYLCWNPEMAALKKIYNNTKKD